ncbi:MAG: xylulokinase [Clostridia bacterium]
MDCFIGIDVGTSSTKSLLMQADGKILGVAQQKYDVMRPLTGYAQQDSETLWQATCKTLQELSGQYPQAIRRVKCVGYSGQMHGLVMLDKANKPLRSIIIWEDQRSVQQIEEIHRQVPQKDFSAITLNTLSTGYLISSLIWVRDKEPEIFERLHTLMLPKDYVRFRMCGEIGTDMSDASSTVVFDTANRTWAWGIIEKLALPKSIFPPCRESYELAGCVSAEAAELTGLMAGTPVVYGGGDTLMHEVGTCMIDERRPWVANIGTSCQVTCAMNQPRYDAAFRTNTFCHVKEDLWMLMSCNLCGGAAMKWLSEMVFPGLSFVELNQLAEKAPVGSEGLIFLPYLNGARCPDHDPRAKGMFMGLTLNHSNAHLARSTIEGVIYSLKNSYDTLESIVHTTPDRVIASGGGARGQLILQMEADAFNKPIYTTVEAEQACIGAAITAAVGVGYYRSFNEACDCVVHFQDTVVEPIACNVQKYNEYFEIYKELYQHNKDLFAMYPKQ